jgi:hypothetical protein
MITIKRWYNECLKKTRLKEWQADDIIEKAYKDGSYMRKYRCPHCQGWHVTSMPEELYNLKTQS